MMVKTGSAVTLLVFFLFVGCSFSPHDTDSVLNSSEIGVLQILLPDGNPYIAEFWIDGSTTGGRSFSRIEPSGTTLVTQDALLAGIWTIRVDAVNTAAEIIFSGSVSVLIQPDSMVSTEITLHDAAGEGTVSFQLEWPAELISNTTVVSFLENIDISEEYELMFTVDRENDVAQYSGEWPVGFYTLQVSLYENTDKVWGEVYAVQITAGTVTSHVATLAVNDLDLPPGTCIWSYSAGEALTSSIWSSAALSLDGKIYFAADTGRLYALDAETGAPDWTCLTDDRIISSPAIGADGTIFVGSCDGNLYAVDPDTGDVIWSFNTGGWVISSPAIGADGTVYVGSYDGYVYAVDQSTGGEIWRFNTGAAVTGSPAVDSSGVVYVGSYNGDVYAILPDGTDLWIYPTGNWVHSSPAVGTDGTVYAGSYNGLLYAIEGSDGSLQWSFDTGDWIGSSPVIDDERSRVYIGSRNGSLFAIDISTGSEVWSFYAGNGGVYSSPAIGNDGVLYFGSYDLNIYAVNPDGSEQWRFRTGIGGVSASPVIGSGGNIYIGSRNGVFYSFASSSSTASESAWPMFHRNALRTGLAD